MARPSLYQPTFPEQARKFCLLGATDIELADLFGISVGALAKWRKRYPEFAEAIRAGKEFANSNVAHSLYKRAVGYTYKEVSVREAKGIETTTTTSKHCPPDVTACIFFLKNRDKRWKDKHETEHVGNVTYGQLTDDELDEKLRRLGHVKPE